MRLVLVEKLVAEGGAFFIKGDGVMGRLELIEGFEQHLGEAVHGADNLAGLAHGQYHRRLARLEGMVGTVNNGVAIK